MSRFIYIIMMKLSNDDKHKQVSIMEESKGHGDKALEDLLSELEQLHKYETVDPQHMDKPTSEVRKEAFNLITMIKE